MKDHAGARLFTMTEHERARGRLNQPGKDAQQSRFARTRWAQHTYEFARMYIERNIFKRMQSAIFVCEDGGEIANGEDRCVGHNGCVGVGSPLPGLGCKLGRENLAPTLNVTE